MKNNKLIILFFLVTNSFIGNLFAKDTQHSLVKTPLESSEMVEDYFYGKPEELLTGVTRKENDNFLKKTNHYNSWFLHSTVFNITPKNGAKIGEVSKKLKALKAKIIFHGEGNSFFEIAIPKELSANEVKLMEKEIVRNGVFTNAQAIVGPWTSMCKKMRISILDFKLPADSASCDQDSDCLRIGTDSCRRDRFILSTKFTSTAKGAKFVALINESKKLCPLIYEQSSCPQGHPSGKFQCKNKICGFF